MALRKKKKDFFFKGSIFAGENESYQTLSKDKPVNNGNNSDARTRIWPMIVIIFARTQMN